MKITICGGGSLGHVCLGVLSCQEGVDVRLHTNHPEQWHSDITVTDNDGKVFNGHISGISNHPHQVIPDADIVLLCLPGYAIEEELLRIKPYLSPTTIVGSIVSSTGFFFAAHRVLSEQCPLFGFQRVPFIARVAEYGRTANLLGYKSMLNLATEQVDNREEFRTLIEQLFNTPTKLLDNYYEASLTNSNPILHTGRLFALWGNWDGKSYKQRPLFYQEFDRQSAQILIDMDAEFMQLLHALHIGENTVPPLLTYYESSDADSLAHKLRNIPAFANIPAPMKEVSDGWIPDFSSRYFTEDFPYGLKVIRDLARKHHISCPTIETVCEWGLSKCNL